jgi:hypothetical protein
MRLTKDKALDFGLSTCDFGLLYDFGLFVADAPQTECAGVACAPQERRFEMSESGLEDGRELFCGR